MDKEELSQHLEILRKELSTDDFITAILDLLGKDPSTEERVILEAKLMARGLHDMDRLARYWERFLHSDDLFQREVAALQLYILAARRPGTLAYRLLTGYLGQEPTEDKIEDIMKERFLRLYPGYKGDK